jgi:hypothetical protein
MTPAQVIVAATLNAADLMKIADTARSRSARAPTSWAADKAVLGEYRELGIQRAVLAIPNLSRDEIMGVLDNHARLAAWGVGNS